jgi:hypothetical protein
MKIFTSCQITPTVEDIIFTLFDHKIEDNDIRCSGPKFNLNNMNKNKRETIGLIYDRPCYTTSLKDMLLDILKTFEEEKYPTITKGKNDFVLKKIEKIEYFLNICEILPIFKELSEECEDLEEWIENIRQFKDYVVEHEKEMNSSEDLINLLDHFNLDWKTVVENLHFDKVLTLFGFPKELAKKISQTPFVQASVQTTIGQEFLKWISNLLVFYHVIGPVADPINAIAAMTSIEPKITKNDNGIEEMFKLFVDSDKSDLWIPDVLIMDSERDDFATLSIFKKFNKNIKVLVQLPKALKYGFTEKDKINLSLYHTMLGHTVFEDKDSLNHKALKSLMNDITF